MRLAVRVYVYLYSRVSKTIAYLDPWNCLRLRISSGWLNFTSKQSTRISITDTRNRLQQYLDDDLGRFWESG
jgi:hypothetical protein